MAPADAGGVGRGKFGRMAGGVLVHGIETGHATSDLVLAADERTRTLRRNQHHVDVLARLNLAEVHVEAMREQQRRAGFDVWLDSVLVDTRLGHVRREHGDQVRATHGVARFGHGKAVDIGTAPGRPAGTQSDHHVEAGILQVERMCAALATVAKHGDTGVLQRSGGGLLIGHGVSPWVCEGDSYVAR
jgi:hypothetical protein